MKTRTLLLFSWVLKCQNHLIHILRSVLREEAEDDDSSEYLSDFVDSNIFEANVFAV